MSDLRNLLDTLRGGSGQRGQDFWRPKESGKYPIRLYRFISPSGQPELFRDSVVHFTGEGPPVPCLGENCTVCKTVEALTAAGDNDSKERARRLRANRRMIFVVVPLKDPTGYKIYEASEGVGKNILLALSKAGGYIGKWPKPEEMDEFFTCLQKGIPHVCGPAGKDIVITFDKTADPKSMYTVDLQPFECKTLPFAEDTSVPDPQVIRQRIETAKAKKAANGGGLVGSAGGTPPA